jgi:hypothetical protein
VKPAPFEPSLVGDAASADLVKQLDELVRASAHGRR